MGEARIHIHAPADNVYALITDVTRMGEWSPETVSAQWVEGATGPAVGAKFKGKNKARVSWSTTVTVTEAEPGRAFAFSTGDTQWRYAITPAGNGCEVIESFEILKEPGRVMQVLNKLGTGAAWADRPQQLVEGMQETLRRLKGAAEASVPGPS